MLRANRTLALPVSPKELLLLNAALISYMNECEWHLQEAKYEDGDEDAVVLWTQEFVDARATQSRIVLAMNP